MLKKLSAVALTVLLGVSSISYPVYARETKAGALPEKGQFATADDLKAFNTDDSDGAVNPAKVYFGKDNQQWWIAGSQSADSMTLFAASPLATDVQFNPAYVEWGMQSYSVDWGCTYTGIGGLDGPEDVGLNHYGGSPLRNTTLKGLEDSYFSPAERSLMKESTIYTDDMTCQEQLENVGAGHAFVHDRYFTQDKLYLAYGKRYNGPDSGGDYITVGENSAEDLTGGLRIDLDYCKSVGAEFFLRAPNTVDTDPSSVLYMKDNGNGTWWTWTWENRAAFAVVPAFEFNLSSVLFASAAPAATSDGALTLADTSDDGAFTLRYSADDLGYALYTDDESTINLRNVPEGTYLVAQNSEGAYAKRITNEEEVTAAEMQLDSFENCEVWLERTDEEERITYAAKAQYGVLIEVAMNKSVEITSGNGIQLIPSGTLIEPITLEGRDFEQLGYYIPKGYADQLNAMPAMKGLTATEEETDNGIVVTLLGTPTGNVKLDLPTGEPKGFQSPPNVTGGVGKIIYGTTTAMEYSMISTGGPYYSCKDGSTDAITYGTCHVRFKKTPTLNASGWTAVELIAPTYTISADESYLEFDTKNEGYSTDGLSKTVTITNTGNSAVTLQSPASQSYDVSLSNTELAPSETAVLTVTPKADLTNGAYKETIKVETGNRTSASIEVSFTVNGALSVSLTSSATEIIDGQSATLTAYAQGGSGEYTYVWYAGDVEDSTLQGSEVSVSPSVTTTYKVVITDTIEDKSAAATITVIPRNYDLDVPGDFTFDQKHVGYEDASANPFTIENIGNVDITNITAALTGANADAFTLDTAGMQDTLAPAGTTSFTVKPNAGLDGGTYTAQVQITGDTGVSKTFEISFTVEDHDYEEWKSDETGHWHECSICSEKTEVTAHTYSDWETVTAPDCENKGSEKRVCEACEFTETREAAPLGHDWEADYTVDKEATCTTEGSKSIHCSRCDAVKDSGVIPAAGHTAGDDWKNDENNHWKECTVCETKLEEAAHTFAWVTDKEATATEAGSKHEECTACGYEKAAVEIPATGGTTEPSEPSNPEEKPSEPSEPSNPEGKPTEPPKDSPQTGDNSNTLLWVLLTGVSAASLSGVLLLQKSRRRKAK